MLLHGVVFVRGWAEVDPRAHVDQVAVGHSMHGGAPHAGDHPFARRRVILADREPKARRLELSK